MTHPTLTSYLTGLALSVALTLLAFWSATHLGAFAPGAIVTLAFLQLLVQMVFFLHLGRSRDSDLPLFLLTSIIIAIVLGGTLWIMANLARYHHQVVPNDLYENGVVAPEHDLH